jgi:hypothetical protein
MLAGFLHGLRVTYVHQYVPCILCELGRYVDLT